MTHKTFNELGLIVFLVLFVIGVYFLGQKIDKQKQIIEEQKTELIELEKSLKDGFAKACVAHGAAEYDSKTGELYFAQECEEGCPECGEEYLWKSIIIEPLVPMFSEINNP